MLKFKLFLLVPIFGLLFAQTWQYGPQTGFRFTRFDGEYFPQTGKVYFLGGRLSNNLTDGTVWAYTPDSGTYRSMGVQMPTPVSNYNICILKDNYSVTDTYGLYIVGGRREGGPKTDVVQVYYPMSNTVRTITTDPLPMRIGGVRIPIPGANVVFDNKMYVFGGFNDSLAPWVSNETWVYTPDSPPGQRWSRITTANLSIARSYITTAIVDNKIYAIGGDIFNGTSLFAQKIVEVFDPNNPSAGWVRVADLPDSSGETRAFGFDSTAPWFPGKIIVAGNGKWPNERNQCFIYNTATDSWALFTFLNQARRNHAGVFIPGTLGSNGIPGMWVFGGRNTTDTNVLRTCEYWQLPLVGLEELSKVPKTLPIQITPNPAYRNLTVSYSLSQPGYVDLAVYTKTGALVKNLYREYQYERKGYQFLLNTQELPSGVYFLRLRVNGLIATKPFTVLK